MNLRRVYLLLLFTGCFYGRAHAQVIYINDLSGNLFGLNMATCNATFIANGPAYNDMAVGANGLIYGLFSFDIWEINPVSGVSTLVGTIPSFNFAVTGLEYGPNGMIYIIGAEVWELNPSNGNIVNNGSLPPNWYCVGDMVYYQGQYYATVYVGAADHLAIIDVDNPANSTLLTTLPTSFLVGGAAVHNETCPKMYWFDSSSLFNPSEVWEFDINTQTWTPVCPGFGLVVGGADSPNDYEFAIPCGSCTTDAGTITGTITDFCVSVPATTTHDDNESLDADDMLQFILFSDLADTLGSILATSNTPSFAFNPATMQIGVTYYIAAIAGNNLNGNVDFNDPCLDISNAIQVTWRPLPTVTFSAANPDVCAGACTTVTANFTGTAPFTLTYTNPVSGAVTQTFSGNTGTFQVCTAAGAPPGSLVVQATALTDAWCVCQ